MVHCDDQVKLFKIQWVNLACPGEKFNTIIKCNLPAFTVGGIPDVVGSRACRIDIEIMVDSRLTDNVLEDSFGCRAPADVSKAYKADTVRGIRDRKSTRLNSSHVATSYAVFCLKKKKVS